MTKDETIEKLRQELKKLRTPPPNDWHSWIDALFHIYLHRFKSVKINSELKLGVQPPRADFVIINEDLVEDLELEIFDIFREHNVIEFKSPNDELSIFTIHKGVGYIEFYIYIMHEQGKDINWDQVTLTFVRDNRPDKLLKELSDYVEEGPAEGIYYIKNYHFPIQIIHSAALKGDKYAGIRVISNNPTIEDIGEMFRQSNEETDSVVKDYLSAYWNISAKLTGEKLEEAKRRYPELSKTIFDIFKPEIDEKINLTVLDNLYRYVQKGGMNVDFAAKEVGAEVSDFIESMQKAGYTVPETA